MPIAQAPLPKHPGHYFQPSIYHHNQKMTSTQGEHKVLRVRSTRAADFPLHNVGRDLGAVDVRIATAQTAIDAGYDINELIPRRGRPLDEALDHDGTAHGGAGNFESLKLIKFLLDNGADPRLVDTTGMCGMNAMETCRAVLTADNRRNEWPFYEQALALMEEAIRNLTGELTQN